MSKLYRILLSVLAISLVMSGCRGWTSEAPPVHPNPNMDTQKKYKPYRESDFFEDKRDMRPNVEGAVARGKLKEDDHFYKGRVNGELVKQLPPQIELTHETLNRGRDRFNVYCAPCHAMSGAGNGMVGRRLKVPPTNFHDKPMYDQPLGHFFEVISNGIPNRTMRGYADKLSEADRWKIAAYVRVLQASQNQTDFSIKAAFGK